MMIPTFYRLKRIIRFILAGLFPLVYCTFVYGEILPFDSERWAIQAGSLVEQYLEQKSLRGSATLKDVVFKNGIIEFDVAFEGGRCYPGISFRSQAGQNQEQFFIRPHRKNYTDVLQYTPVFNGVASWQLYSGQGFTAAANIPNKQWIHVRLEVSGTQARVYLNKAPKPALVIPDLKHGISEGAISLTGPANGQAHFANFSVAHDQTLTFPKPPPAETPPGTITDWELSPSFTLSQIDIEHYPDKTVIPDNSWRKVKSTPDGLVDIARFFPRSGPEPDCVYARTTIHADEAGTKQLSFGYSDAISIFINGTIVFFGNSAYRQRDPSFLGIIGLNDAVYLPLNKGKNVLLLLVAESFGGWGFMCRDEDEVFLDSALKKNWERKSFKMPESVVYDPTRNVLLVSNFGRYESPGSQFVSRLSLEGDVEELTWIKGLAYPTGMCIYKDNLYIVERNSIVEVDIVSGQIKNRLPVPGPLFLNDIAVTPWGEIFVSDSRKNVIFRCVNGKCEEWLVSKDIEAPNGLLVHQNKLLVGNNGDHCLKAVDLSNKEVTIIARFGPGTIDGIKIDHEGNYLVSQYEGRIYRISLTGEMVKLLDTTGPGQRTADFEYIPHKKLLAVPGLETNQVIAYSMNN